MSDLLTHALAGYVLGTIAAWTTPLPRRHVPFVVAGAVLPDMAKVYLLFGSVRSTVLGVEFGWLALQTLGAALLAGGVVALAVTRPERRVGYASLVVGVGVHIALDYLVVRVGGVNPPYLYPFTWAQLPEVGLYLSSDVWPAAVAVPVAVAVWLVDRRRVRR